MENSENKETTETPAPIAFTENAKVVDSAEAKGKKKKVSLAEFKVKSFVTDVKVEQMQFLKTAGGSSAAENKKKLFS